MSTQARPPIHLTASEAEMLADLALAAEHRQPDVAALLLDEIERAQIHADDALPASVIRMGSIVEFVDEGSAVRRTLQLVYPPEADMAAGRLSILTLVGAGLIGLAEGQSILWPDRDGHERRLRIVTVRPAQDQPPPSARNSAT